ncbi:hypothetical protein RHMOL_Rhmol13G0086500 [Rhododendron molle]|uniref:Uncharacterized protein n=1 Tax=Rhododendron molle TaxID=49168 RepID=A0ACC0L4X4_RHOML|nr:hypothetical protein RHMOL_Rhmol13G0086500 [Rhododendron molle]
MPRSCIFSIRRRSTLAADRYLPSLALAAILGDSCCHSLLTSCTAACHVPNLEPANGNRSKPGTCLTGNRFYGKFPQDIGFTLPNLFDLYVSRNQFTGHLPISLSNASGLRDVNFGFCNFTGTMPTNLGSLKGLEKFSVAANQLETDEAEGFSFLTSLTNCSNLQILVLGYNRFKGALPASLANFSTSLQWLSLGDNQISGSIPEGVKNLIGLTRLAIFMNSITGEIPDEYGMGSKSSIQGDVYSFGILVLEMFTGRRPTDMIFEDGWNLHQFTKMALPERVMEIADPSLLLELPSVDENTTTGNGKMKECLVAVLTIGISCSMESPLERMDMRDVVAELSRIRTKTFPH